MIPESAGEETAAPLEDGQPTSVTALAAAPLLDRQDVASSLSSLSVPDVVAVMGSTLRGLSPAEAAERQTLHGPNELPGVSHGHVWRQLVTQFTDLFAVVLLVASAITFLAYLLGQPRDPATLQLALAILGVVLLNAGIGFAQEYSAERTAESLQAMVPHTCRVLRDGERSPTRTLWSR
ncbi:cation-transporting P-type ATPase [Streptomyces sp. NBC_00568]|uniref:cation-transporting P-type ATPase n=1 Tax=Streptomyces sp. NBC_00568 TaxID=2975779 RepID=UPI002B1DEC17|nr:cation-transporting P-type ATPase [Streptomyces sp. NBC_00568]